MPDTINSYFLNHDNIIEGTPGHDLIIFMISKGTNSNITNNIIQDMAPLSRIMVTRTDKPNEYDVWYMPRDWNSGRGPGTRLRNIDLWDTIQTADGN